MFKKCARWYLVGEKNLFPLVLEGNGGKNKAFGAYGAPASMFGREAVLYNGILANQRTRFTAFGNLLAFKLLICHIATPNIV